MGGDAGLYIEDQYIYEQFMTNFIHSHSENIIIYGTGIHTRRLLEQVQNPRIVGLMDAKRTGEILWGYKVLSYEEAVAIEQVLIMILARNAVINVIYRRIERFCREYDIPVFDINGNNLRVSHDEAEARTCFILKEQELRAKIEDADVVTFDIFDTLLTRCVMRPRDIFTVVECVLNQIVRESGEPDRKKTFCFLEERIKAESAFSENDNPTIYEIYEQFQRNTKITDVERTYLLNLEIGCEKRFLKKRQKMCDLLLWAEELGKEVYLISDMYFTKDILEDILDSFQIRGHKDILVSCEYRRSKQEGLFHQFRKMTDAQSDHLKKTLHAEEKKYLHIGDHYFSDIIAAKQAGFRTFRIYSTMEMLESSLYSRMISDKLSLEENIVISHYAAKAYNNPFGEFEKNGKLIFHTIEEITGTLIAPIIFKYMLWLVQNITKSDYDLVIFPSRDGFLLKKIYQHFQEKEKKSKLPEPLYLYTSRRAALTAAAQSESDVQYILNVDFSGNVQEMLKARFGMDIETAADQAGQVQGEADLSKILSHCAEERKNYCSYIRGTGLGDHRQIAILDFVAMGSVQEALERLLNTQFTGFYFLKRSADKPCMKGLRCLSFYKESGDFQNDSNIYKYYYFLESIVTSYEPTFWGIDESGKKLFYQESRSKEELIILEKIHDEILRYCSEMLDLFPDLFNRDKDIKVYDTLLGFFSKDYSVLENWNWIKNIDEFMGRTVSEVNR